MASDSDCDWDVDTPTKRNGRLTFSLKLYQVACDGQLIQWTADGKGVIVEEHDFEKNVMDLYPGFVQTPSFHNLKRLFRDYNFSRRVLRRRKPHGWKIEFRNALFTKDNIDGVTQVRAKERPCIQQPFSVRRGRYSRRHKYHTNYNYMLTGISKSKSKRQFSRIRPGSKAKPITITYSRTDANNVFPSINFKRHEHCEMADDLLRHASQLPNGASNTGHKQGKARLMLSRTGTPKKRSFIGGNNSTEMTDATSDFLYLPDTGFQRKSDGFELLQIFGSKELPVEEYVNLIVKKCDETLRAESSVPSFDTVVNRLSQLVRPDVSPFHFSCNSYELNFNEL